MDKSWVPGDLCPVSRITRRTWKVSGAKGSLPPTHRGSGVGKEWTGGCGRGGDRRPKRVYEVWV